MIFKKKHGGKNPNIYLLKNIIPASPDWMQHKLGDSKNVFQQLHSQLAWNKPPLPTPLRHFSLRTRAGCGTAINFLTTRMH